MAKRLSQIVLILFAIFFIYVFIKAIEIVNRREINAGGSIYINSTSSSKYIKDLAYTLTKHCKSDICKVQSLLDYVTNIPYRVNHFKAHSPKQTLENNFGDCDDKSNLLISLLHVLGYKSYFILVPKHIFVVVALDEIHLKRLIKGLYINGEKFYILETTAKGSRIGYPLRYELKDIKAIIEPFENREIKIKSLEYKI